MGYRLHGHTKHEIKLSNGVCNFGNNDVNCILWNMCDYCGNTECYDSDTEIEVPETDLRKLVEGIKNGSITKETLEEECGDISIDIMEFAKNMEYILETADTHDGYVHMSWF